MSFAYRWDDALIESNKVALVLHGTGGDEHSLVPFAESLMPGAAILSLRGRILENGSPRFFRRFGEGVFDYDNIREEADALSTFVTKMASEKGFEAKNVTAIGYSNGANIAAATFLLHPEFAGSAMLFRPMVTLTPTGISPDSALLGNPDLTGKRLFFSNGERDGMVPKASVEALGRQFRDSGADVTQFWHAGGHELGREEIEAAKLWSAGTGKG